MDHCEWHHSSCNRVVCDIVCSERSSVVATGDRSCCCLEFLMLSEFFRFKVSHDSEVRLSFYYGVDEGIDVIG
ncbi:hypothetical protein D3C80_1878040 [compost metagenome]